MMIDTMWCIRRYDVAVFGLVYFWYRFIFSIIVIYSKKRKLIEGTVTGLPHRLIVN